MRVLRWWIHQRAKGTTGKKGSIKIHSIATIENPNTFCLPSFMPDPIVSSGAHAFKYKYLHDLIHFLSLFFFFSCCSIPSSTPIIPPLTSQFSYVHSSAGLIPTLEYSTLSSLTQITSTMSSPHAPTAPAGGPNTSQRRSSRIANINAEKAKAPSAGAGRPANRNKSPHRRRNSAGAGRGGISKTKGKQPNRSSPHHAGPSADPGATTADPGATTASPAGPAGPAASPGGAVVNATPPRQGSPAASPGGATANDSPNTTPPLNSPIDNSGAGPSGIKRTVCK